MISDVTRNETSAAARGASNRMELEVDELIAVARRIVSKPVSPATGSRLILECEIAELERVVAKLDCSPPQPSNDRREA